MFGLGLRNPLPLIGIIVVILMFKPLKGGGLLNMGLHYQLFEGSEGHDKYKNP